MPRARSGPTFIGLSRQVSSEQKAIWHNVTGAGKSQVIRRFFDVGEAEAERVRQRFAEHVQAHLDKA